MLMVQLRASPALHEASPNDSSGDLLLTRVATTGGRPVRKVLLIVSGRLFRDGLKNMLQTANMTIVADCDTLADAAGALEGCDKPDLVVVGAQSSDDLTDKTKLQALRSRLPGTRWIVLCNMPVANLLRNAVGAGIDSILLQDIPAEILHHVVELMMLGHSLVPWELTAHLTVSSETLPIVLPPRTVVSDTVSPNAGPHMLGGQAPDRVTPHPDLAVTGLTRIGNGSTAMAADGIQYGVPGTQQPTLTKRHSTPDLPLPSGHADSLVDRAIKLSDREAEILQCLVNGASNKAIARDLKIAEATVKVHLKGLLRKMRLQNRTQAAIWALNNAHAVKVSAESPADSRNGAVTGVAESELQGSGQNDLDQETLSLESSP